MLTVFYSSTLDKTVAYHQVGQNVFEAVGVWTEDEVRMTLRLLKYFPVGSWNRGVGTIQFAIVLMMARSLAGVQTALEEFGQEEIYRALAEGATVIGKRVAVQPEYVSGVEILVVDPATDSADDYELVYDHAAQTLAWQKATTTSTNTIPIDNGSFDILDETGALFVRVRIRPDELPPESRTETFDIEDVSSRDYLAQVSDNYLDGRLPRLGGENDTDYRARILTRLATIRTTKWGIQYRLKELLGYVPRVEETREDFEDWFLAGVGAPGGGTFMPGTPDTFFSGASSANYFMTVRVKEADKSLQSVIDAVAEAAPASRRLDIQAGYGVEMARLDAEDAVLDTVTGATIAQAGTIFEHRELLFDDTVDEHADFTFRIPDDYSGEGVNISIFYRADDDKGRALINLSERSVTDDGVWDAPLTLVREVKLRAPFSLSDSREDFAILDPSWTAGHMAQISIERKATDNRDDLIGDFRIFGVRIYKRT